MEALKVDKTKLKTVHNYAKAHNVTPAAIYKRIEKEKQKGEIKTIVVEIDGIKFIQV